MQSIDLIDKFQFVDMFPMTGKGDFDIHNVHSCHVEVVNLLQRMSNGKVDSYVKHSEPSRREWGYARYTAMGLQAVDDLKTSDL